MQIRRLASPRFIKGPVDTRPLNMATMRPVALTMRLSTGVKANIKGVNRTPPPIPPMTATRAMAKLRKKNPKSHAHITGPGIPPGGVSLPMDISARAMYEIMSTPSMMLTSSQGDLSNLRISFVPFYTECK